MDAIEPAEVELRQDPIYVALVQTTAGEDRDRVLANLRTLHQILNLRKESGSDFRSKTEDGPACQQHKEKLLLPAETAAIHQAINHNGRHEDIGHSLVSSRVDYCNSIFYGVTNAILRRLQSVLNTASTLITNTRKFDHITPVLRDQLHWLPIRQHIIFKIATFVRNSFPGRGPTYLSRSIYLFISVYQSCIPISEIWARVHLRSCGTGTPHHTADQDASLRSKKLPCLRTGCVELPARRHYNSKL